MHRRTVAVFGLALLALLAGCGGMFGTETTSTPGNNSTAANGGPVHDLPLDGEAVLNSHAAALNQSGSFVYQQNTSARLVGNQSGFINYKNVTAATNITADRILSQERLAIQPSRETYSDGNGTVYQRQRNRTTTAFASYDDEAANTSVYLRPPLDGYFSGLDFEKANTTTVDGTTVDVYTVTDTSQLAPSKHDISGFTPSNYESLTVVAAIDRQGILRSFEYRAVSSNAQGSDIQFDLSIQYTGIGSTEVSAPNWLPRAQNATS